MELIPKENNTKTKVLTVIQLIVACIQLVQPTNAENMFSNAAGDLADQALRDKTDANLQKCFQRNCSFRTTLSDYWSCIHEHCADHPTNKRWIDTGYYEQKRRSAGGQVERCIRMACKNADIQFLGKCIEECDNLIPSSDVGDNKNKRASTSNWVDPTVYGKRIPSTTKDQLQFIGRLDNLPFIPSIILRKRSKTMDIINALEEEFSPKRWLDPMSYKKDRAKMMMDSRKRRSTSVSKVNDMNLCKGTSCGSHINPLKRASSQVIPLVQCFHKCGHRGNRQQINAELHLCLQTCFNAGLPKITSR